MVTFLVPAHLTDLLEDDPSRASCLREITLKPGSWAGVVDEIRLRFPALAERVLTTDDVIAPGFVLVVNDRIVRGECLSLLLSEGDECCVIAAIAGG